MKGSAHSARYIMTNEVHSALSGTETEKALNRAFDGEARSHMKYMLYSDAAERAGDEYLSEVLEDIADNEKEHAEIWLEYLGELNSDAANLESMLNAEEYEHTVTYPELADIAESEGFTEIAQKMRMTANAENTHAAELRNILEQMTNGTRYANSTAAKWRCSNCGYTHTGTQAPERCPLCSHKRTAFVKVKSYDET